MAGRTKDQKIKHAIQMIKEELDLAKTHMNLGEKIEVRELDGRLTTAMRFSLRDVTAIKSHTFAAQVHFETLTGLLHDLQPSLVP